MAKSSGDHTPLGGFVYKSWEPTDDCTATEDKATLDTALAFVARIHSAAIDHGKTGARPRMAPI
jgi:hypothetical protein